MVTNIKRSRKEQAGQQARLTSADALLAVPNVLRQMMRKRELRTMRSGIMLGRQQSSLVGVGGHRKSLATNQFQNRKLSRKSSRKSSKMLLSPDRRGGENNDDAESLGSLDDEASVSSSVAGDDPVVPSRRRSSALTGEALRRQTSLGPARPASVSPSKLNSQGVDLEQSSTPTQPLLQPPAYTQAMALDLIIEVYGKTWNAYMQGSFEPMSTYMREALSRARLCLRSHLAASPPLPCTR